MLFKRPMLFVIPAGSQQLKDTLPAGIQQNMLFNISRCDPRELKTVLKKLRSSYKYFFVNVFFQPNWDSSDPAGIQQNML